VAKIWSIPNVKKYISFTIKRKISNYDNKFVCVNSFQEIPLELFPDRPYFVVIVKLAAFVFLILFLFFKANSFIKVSKFIPFPAKIPNLNSSGLTFPIKQIYLGRMLAHCCMLGSRWCTFHGIFKLTHRSQTFIVFCLWS